MSGRTLWYPFLFAALPVLHTLTRNPGGTRLDDAAVVTAASLVICGIIYGVVAAALRGRGAKALVPLIVLFGILLIYGKTTLGQFARDVGGIPPVAVLAALAGLLLLIVWWLGRRSQLLDRVNTFLTLTGLLMVGWLGLRFAADLARARSVVRNSDLARELAQPLQVRPALASGPNVKRDIYLIVLDEYANSAVLRELFQFDNRVFEDSLRQLGFTIPRLVRSNYVHTLLSLPSLLNFSHLTRIPAEVGDRSSDATLPNYLLEHNRTATFLRQQGYRYLFFPSQWWPSTSRSRTADWHFQAWDGFNLLRETTRSDLRRSFLRTTAFDLLGRDHRWDADHVQRTLRGLEQVSRLPEPTFAFAHLVSPHWPYVFRPNCRVAAPTVIRARADRQRAYTAQLQCLNRLVLQTVTGILRQSSVEPIIVIQGDHGTNLRWFSSTPSPQEITPAQSRERLGAFGAYYMPAGGARLFADTVTIVNVFQKVLSHYLGAQVEPASDELYVSTERMPYWLRSVTPASLEP
jgi:hypothetical protein